MIQPVAQAFTAGAAIIRSIGLEFQQDMAAKAAEFSMAGKAIRAGTWWRDMDHRLPKGAPDIKADRGWQVARIHRKTIRQPSAHAWARRRNFGQG
jgi:hypothetical protein